MKQRIGIFTKMAMGVVAALALASVSLTGGTAEAAKPSVQVTSIRLNPNTTATATTGTTQCQLVLNIEWNGNALDKKKGLARVFVTNGVQSVAPGYRDYLIGGRTDGDYQFTSNWEDNSSGTYHVEVVISSAKGPGGQDPGRTLAFKAEDVDLYCG